MAELENEEVNRELCALAIEDMIDSWSPETQEQFLSEWNDWQKDGETIGFSCAECSKVFTRPDNLKRHVKSVHSREKSFTCDECGKRFGTNDKLKQHQRSHQEKLHECSRCQKKFGRKVIYFVVVTEYCYALHRL